MFYMKNVKKIWSHKICNWKMILVACSENVDIFLWHYTESQQAVVFSRLAAILKQSFITDFLYFVTWKSIDPICTFN